MRDSVFKNDELNANGLVAICINQSCLALDGVLVLNVFTVPIANFD